MKLTKRENDLADFATERIEALGRELIAAEKKIEDLRTAIVAKNKENEELLAAIVDHTNRAAELAKERDALRKDLEALSARNAELLAERDDLLVETEKLDKKYAAALQKADEKQKALIEYVDRFNNLETEHNIKRMELTSAKDQIAAQVEVIERLKVQNSNFCEEQREAMKRADATAASLVKARNDVSRLVKLLDDFKAQLVAVKKAKESVCSELMLQQAMTADMQADYDARGKVIKKLRKRLHKLKKKLKH